MSSIATRGRRVAFLESGGGSEESASTAMLFSTGSNHIQQLALEEFARPQRSRLDGRPFSALNREVLGCFTRSTM